MLTRSFRGRVPSAPTRLLHATPPQRLAAPATHEAKAAGNISSVFPSLSGKESPPLAPRFADLKRHLIQGHEEQVQESWHRLLADLRQETGVIRDAGSSIIPEISFSDVKYDNIPKMTEFRDKLRKRGVAIVRGVVSEQEALGWKELIKRYIQLNPSVTGKESPLFLQSPALSLYSLQNQEHSLNSPRLPSGQAGCLRIILVSFSGARTCTSKYPQSPVVSHVSLVFSQQDCSHFHLQPCGLCGSPPDTAAWRCWICPWSTYRWRQL